jgi:hypothetical protein
LPGPPTRRSENDHDQILERMDDDPCSQRA